MTGQRGCGKECETGILRDYGAENNTIRNGKRLNNIYFCGNVNLPAIFRERRFISGIYQFLFEFIT